MPTRLSLLRLFAYCSLLLFANVVQAGKVVTLFGTYPARAADFGMEIVPPEQINVMYPPIDSKVILSGDQYGPYTHARSVRSLCDFASEMMMVPNVEEFLPSNDAPIAFLVDIRGCSPQRQAMVAATMQRLLSPKIQYLILQGMSHDGDSLPALQLTKLQDSLEPLSGIGILLVSYQSGIAMKGHIAQRYDLLPEGLSPFFMDPSGKNKQWTLLTAITQQQQSDGSLSAALVGVIGAVVGVTVVMGVVCVVYLWWSSGGRIRFRRDASGRIRGLRYVPPARYHWLCAGCCFCYSTPPSSQVVNVVNSVTMIRTTTLTEHEFSELPEIMFYSRLDVVSAAKGPEEHPHQLGTTSNDEPEMLVPQQSSTSTSGGEGEITSLDEKNTEDPPDVEWNAVDESPVKEEEEKVDGGAASRREKEEEESTTMSCTTCSICIEDFVQGETLVLLPQCQHAFHRGCIHPWLTERQGCCPFCKTNVLRTSSEGEDKDDGDEEVHQARS